MKNVTYVKFEKVGSLAHSLIFTADCTLCIVDYIWPAYKGCVVTQTVLTNLTSQKKG